MNQRRRVRQRGWVMLDAIAGLAMLFVLTGLVVTFSHRAGTSRQHLADQRAAARLAEEALLNARLGKPAEGQAVTLEALPTDTPAPERQRWSRAIATVGNATVQVVGLTPDPEVSP